MRRYVCGVEEVLVWCCGGTCVLLRRYVEGVLMSYVSGVRRYVGGVAEVRRRC